MHYAVQLIRVYLLGFSLNIILPIRRKVNNNSFKIIPSSGCITSYFSLKVLVVCSIQHQSKLDVLIVINGCMNIVVHLIFNKIKLIFFLKQEQQGRRWQ